MTTVASLPRDLDDEPYRVFEFLGPWKVTPCCGATAKGAQDGIVCRSCYRMLDEFDDAPARLPGQTTCPECNTTRTPGFPHWHTVTCSHYSVIPWPS